jgi:hypothetical protein
LKSTVVARPAALLVVAGGSTATVTVTLKDSAGAPVRGKSVHLGPVSGLPVTYAATTISPTTATSDASGVATFTVKGHSAGTAVYQATDVTDAVPLTRRATVKFVSATLPDPAHSTAVVILKHPTVATVTVTLENGLGTPLGNQQVALTRNPQPLHATGAGITGIVPHQQATDSAGVAVFSVAGAASTTLRYAVMTQTHPLSQQLSGLLTFTITFGGTAPRAGGKGWAATAVKFEGKTGQEYSYVCPAGGTRNPVWGTVVYTYDSSVCTAAVNYGVITVASGGTVTITMQAGRSSYTASNRNGTTSEAFHSSPASFTVVGTPKSISKVGFGGSGWTANATDYRGRNGQRYVYSCPANGTATAESVYGTDLYTDDSSVCTAAVHAGLITLSRGGEVTIEIRPGAATYTGSTRNGITSGDYDSGLGSYVFVTGG